MTPRPDLSNYAVAIETGDAELSCIARPRYRGLTFIASAVGTFFSILPVLSIGPSWRRYVGRGHHAADLVEVLIYGVPFVLAMAVLVNVLARIRRPHGFTIRMGVVTLMTPDDAIAKHVFELNNLNSAVLTHGAGVSGVNLQMIRRRGMPVTVLRGYAQSEIGHLVDLVNDMVLDDRSFAFEVIVPPPNRPKGDCQPTFPPPSAQRGGDDV